MKAKLFLLLLFTATAQATDCGGQVEEKECDVTEGHESANAWCKKNYPCADPTESAICYESDTNLACQTFCKDCDCPSERAGSEAGGAGGGLLGGRPLQTIDINNWP